MTGEGEQALEAAWQEMLVSTIPLRDSLSMATMLRRAFEAGWDARGAHDPLPEEGS